MAELHRFARAGEAATKGPDGVHAIDALHRGGILCNDEVAEALDFGICGNRKIDSLLEKPSRDVDGVRAGIVELHEFIMGGVRFTIIVDLIDDDLRRKHRDQKSREEEG